MSLWWLQQGWTETRCSRCGNKIWPEGDPDCGVCYSCFQEEWERQQKEDELLALGTHYMDVDGRVHPKPGNESGEAT